MWRLETIFCHIHGFSADTQARMFLLESQHVTAMENLPDYEAYDALCFLSFLWIWVHLPGRELPQCWPPGSY